KTDRFQRDLPALSDIEITLEIDASRVLKARAYIPALDEEFSEIIRFQQSTPDLETLRADVRAEQDRLDDLRARAGTLENDLALGVLGRIDAERMLEDLDSALDAARSDPDAADKCQQRLLDLRSAVDEV